MCLPSKHIPCREIIKVSPAITHHTYCLSIQAICDCEVLCQSKCLHYFIGELATKFDSNHPLLSIARNLVI
ncbi:hypothetical protein FGO68_gene4418 [Halteria grandinella]|uniref:Uncharacterized protein n=1 Tax=Halteria grandinella TaxID=5974 RepID=A0A8J8P7D9_HALGN|nr:hypothetical protein FGO68_gene4418 [Halteria grandinella]